MDGKIFAAAVAHLAANHFVAVVIFQPSVPIGGPLLNIKPRQEILRVYITAPIFLDRFKDMFPCEERSDCFLRGMGGVFFIAANGQVKELSRFQLHLLNGQGNHVRQSGEIAVLLALRQPEEQLPFSLQ